MIFSDAVFLFLFFPVTLLVYYLPFLKNNISLRNIWLFIVSLLFYAWGEPLHVLLMLLSIAVNYVLGRVVETCPKSKKGKLIVALACVFNLGVLFIFKYLSWALNLFGVSSSALSNLVLPIGISFYTFQALSYVVDVYRKKDKAQTSIISLGLYIAFFPQLVAGPIVRYGSIAAQIKSREHSFEKFSDGACRFGIGMAKKVLLANQLASFTDLTFALNGSELSVALAWMGALGYMLQIYFDFSGYSDMAIGLGKMFGFTFNENFNYPYLSTSIAEYWRRWHISLGEWFRDYLYYPLALGPAIRLRKRLSGKCSRKTAGLLSTCFVLFIVWMATGIWHGASLNFVIWGLIQFVFIVWEQNRKPMRNRKLAVVLGFCSTYLIVLLTKVIFKSEDMGQAIAYYASMLHLNGNALIDSTSIYWLGQYKIVLLVGLIFSFPVVEKINALCSGKSIDKVWCVCKLAAMICLFIVSSAYSISGGYNPFIYFNF